VFFQILTKLLKAINFITTFLISCIVMGIFIKIIIMAIDKSQVGQLSVTGTLRLAYHLVISRLQPRYGRIRVKNSVISITYKKNTLMFYRKHKKSFLSEFPSKRHKKYLNISVSFVSII